MRLRPSGRPVSRTFIWRRRRCCLIWGRCIVVEGRQEASHSFTAAGASAYLGDNASTKASMRSFATVDVSLKCTGMLERLMLAEAQECVFENTIAKGSTPGVCAKISRQCLSPTTQASFLPILPDSAFG